MDVKQIEKDLLDDASLFGFEEARALIDNIEAFDLKDISEQRLLIVGYRRLLDWLGGVDTRRNYTHLALAVDFWTRLIPQISGLLDQGGGPAYGLRGFCLSLWDEWRYWIEMNGNDLLVETTDVLSSYLGYFVGIFFPGFHQLEGITKAPTGQVWRQPLTSFLIAAGREGELPNGIDTDLCRFVYSVTHFHNVYHGTAQVRRLNQQELSVQLRSKRLAESCSRNQMLNWEEFFAGSLENVDADRHCLFFCFLYSAIDDPNPSELVGLTEFVGSLAPDSSKSDLLDLRGLLIHWAAKSAFIAGFLQERVGYEFMELTTKTGYNPHLPSPTGCDHIVAVAGTESVGKTYFMFATEEAEEDQDHPVSVRSRLGEESAELERKEWRQGKPSFTRDFDLVAQTSVDKLLRFQFFDIPGGYVHPTHEGNRMLVDFFSFRNPSALLLLIDRKAANDIALRKTYLELIAAFEQQLPTGTDRQYIPVYLLLTKADERISEHTFDENTPEVDALIQFIGGQTPFFTSRGRDCASGDEFIAYVENSTAINRSLSVRKQFLHDLRPVKDMLAKCFDVGFCNLTVLYTDCRFPEKKSEVGNLIGVSKLWKDLYSYMQKATVKSRKKSLLQFAERVRNDRSRANHFAEMYGSTGRDTFVVEPITHTPGSLKDEFKTEYDKDEPSADNLPLSKTIREVGKRKCRELSNRREKQKRRLNAVLTELGIPERIGEIRRPDASGLFKRQRGHKIGGLVSDYYDPTRLESLAQIEFAKFKKFAQENDWGKSVDKANAFADKEDAFNEAFGKMLALFPPDDQLVYPRDVEIDPLRGCIQNLCTVQSWPLRQVQSELFEVGTGSVLDRLMAQKDEVIRRSWITMLTNYVPHKFLEFHTSEAGIGAGDVDEHRAKGLLATTIESGFRFTQNNGESKFINVHELQRKLLVGEAIKSLQYLDEIEDAKNCIATMEEAAIMKCQFDMLAETPRCKVEHISSLSQGESEAGKLIRAKDILKRIGLFSRKETKTAAYEKAKKVVEELIPMLSIANKRESDEAVLMLGAKAALISTLAKSLAKEDGESEVSLAPKNITRIELTTSEFDVSSYVEAIKLSAQHAEASSLKHSGWLAGQRGDAEISKWLEVNFREGLHRGTNADAWLDGWCSAISGLLESADWGDGNP